MRIGDVVYEKVPVPNDVPQGSDIELILFLNMANDLTDGHQLSWLLFADDTKMRDKSEDVDLIEGGLDKTAA